MSYRFCRPRIDCFGGDETWLPDPRKVPFDKPKNLSSMRHERSKPYIRNNIGHFEICGELSQWARKILEEFIDLDSRLQQVRD
jgi:hypothetical protein